MEGRDKIQEGRERRTTKEINQKEKLGRRYDQ